MKKLVQVLTLMVFRHTASWCLLMGVTILASAHAAAAPASSGQSITKPAFEQLSQLKRTLFTVKDGLPSTIYAITEDREGYLWLGGPTGLFRFDGLNFEPMFKEQLPAEIITSLYGDRDGNLWIGGLHGNVTRVHEGVTEQVGRGLSKGTIMSFKQMTDGTLWVVTSSGVYRFVDGAWHRADHSDGIDVKFVWVTGTGVDGSYWIFAPDGAYRLRPGAKRFELTSANQGIVAMANLPATAAYPSGGVTADLIVDRQGALWIPTNGKLTRLHTDNMSGQAQLVAENVMGVDNHSDIQVTADFSDSQGNVWVATPDGLEQFRTTRFVPLVLPLPVFWPAITEDNTQALWVASASATPPIRVGTNVSVHPDLSGSSPCIANGPDGSVWFNGDKGIQRYIHDQVITIPAPPATGQQASLANPKQDCVDMRLAPDGSLWVSMRFTGVTRWDGHVWSTIDPKAATSIQFDGTRAWLAFLSGNLTSIDQGKLSTYSSRSGPDLGSLRKLRLGKSGLWIAGDDGIAIRTADRFIHLVGMNGERFQNASGLLQLSNGDLWISSARGVYRASAADVQSALSAPDHSLRFTLFDRDDGVEDAKNLVVSDDGRLWVSMRQGVAWIDALQMPPAPQAAHVSIESINDHDVRFSGASVPALEKGTRSVTITYAAATLSDPAKSRFRFLLKGVDEDWQLASDRRAAHYANLGPGQYTFEVEASNADGAWAAQPTRFAFQILPEFYQTWWFKALCAAVVLAGLWLLHLMRIRHIHAQLDARTRERESMARDFHDTILQNFQSLLLHVQVAVQSIPEGAARQKLDKALSVTENALNEGRDKIGELRSLAEPMEDLSIDISHLANRLNEMYPTEFSMNVEGEPRPLNASAASDVHAIVGELITNAFRHSQASALHVELHYDRSELNITVIDDGRGADLSALPSENSGHWGLQGIRERTRRVGGRFTIGVAPSGKGTRANLKIPARFVYAGRRLFHR
ncbi:sensor histidine kinase [Rhodanobacter sp. C05]|uniref:sensor histidine kinase n=1 Tax=Rhodanobacter sp. C05 TaxID=1945855 RepID=UPI000987C47E|nr:sensor histidine kinase [Rhodanobacter sp. C05]